MHSQAHNPESFPITGVAGVLGGTAAELVEQEVSLDARVADSVEIRADLFPTIESALAAVTRLAPRLPVLFTVRSRDEGGRWDGDAERVPLYQQAIERGATLVDAELRSEAARRLAAARAPLLASVHDFEAPIGRRRLDRLADDAQAIGAFAVKIVPTAARPVDGLTVLEWVAARAATDPHRVGFAMRDAGAFSRILSIAWGAPFTYGALGAAVAPGQISATELTQRYRTAVLTRATRVFGVVDAVAAKSLTSAVCDPPGAAEEADTVFVPLEIRDASDLERLRAALPLAGVCSGAQLGFRARG